jgi:hypothetical protein
MNTSGLFHTQLSPSNSKESGDFICKFEHLIKLQNYHLGFLAIQ